MELTEEVKGLLNTAKNLKVSLPSAPGELKLLEFPDHCQKGCHAEGFS